MRRPRLLLALVVLLAAALRLAHFTAVVDSPLAELHRWDQSDMAFFHEWGGEVAAGDLLGREPLHPLHGWHVEVVRQAMDFDARWAEEVRAEAQRTGETPADVAWRLWYGGTRFHQAPFYPYLVGATQAVFGPSPFAVFAWQVLLGLASTVLVFVVGRRAFDERAGLLAALLHAGMPIVVHHETTLLRVSLITFLGLAVTALVGAALDSEGRRRRFAWAGAGLVAGLAMLTKATLVALPVGAVALVVLLVVRRDVSLRTAAWDVSLLVAGALVALSPLVARNLAVGAPPLATSSVGAITFARANAADVPADVPALLSVHAGRIMVESDGAFRPAVRATLATWESPWDFAASRVARLGEVLRSYERPNNANPAFAERLSPALRLMPVGMLILAPFGVLGVAIALPRWRRAGPALVLVGAHLAPMLAFHVLARYRAPFAVALTVFAAVAILSVVSWARARDWRRLVPALLVVALVGAWSVRERPSDALPVRASDIALGWQLHHAPRAQRAIDAGDFDAAAAEVARALEPAAPELRRLAAASPARREEARLAAALAALVEQRARFLERAGRAEEAAAEHERAGSLRAAAAPPTGR